MVDYLVTVSTANSMRTLHCKDSQPENKAVVYAVLVVCLAIHIAAIVDASKGKGNSTTYSADILLSVLSPIMYWILKLFGVVGERIKA